MRVTVAICTWNRAALLRETLASLRSLRVPEGIEWKVLVVDNGSTDETPAVSESFGRVLPIELVSESRAGLSNARNRAVEEAGGDYLLWIDDDVFVDPLWLSEYVEAFRRWDDAAVFGGPILPLLEGNPPSWLTGSLDQIRGIYAYRDLGDRPRDLGLAEEELPFGCNFGIRMAEQRKFSYSATLGRKRGSLGLGREEIVLVTRILASGKRGRWVPGARVQHRIGADRQSKAYLRRYAFWDGVSERLLDDRATRVPWALEAVRLFGEAGRHEIRYQIRRWISPASEWVTDLLSAGDRWGRFVAHVRRADSDW